MIANSTKSERAFIAMNRCTKVNKEIMINSKRIEDIFYFFEREWLRRKKGKENSDRFIPFEIYRNSMGPH